MNYIKKFPHSCWMKKIQSGPCEWNCYFQLMWFGTWYIFRGQLNLLGICERRSRNYQISLLLGLITAMLVFFFNHEGFFQLLVQSAVTRPECMLQGDFP